MDRLVELDRPDSGMAFGQPPGPPASARQIKQLLDLVQAAGHTDFRDARGPLHLTQRQAGGKFTVAEAEALIASLEEEQPLAPDVPRPRTVAGRSLRLHMSLIDQDGTVVASADEPFEVGGFDLAAARQGMRKLLAGLGGITDTSS